MLDPVSFDVLKPGILVVQALGEAQQHSVEMLEEWGYVAQRAFSGKQAFEFIKAQGMQLVLADWQLGDMEGLAFCARLRELALSHYTYVILMSDVQTESALIQALDCGADDVLAKPIDTHELEARLQSAMRRVALQSRLSQQNAALAQAHDVIAQDLRTVSQLQRSYLPDRVGVYPDLDYHWLSVPSQYVSGDHLNVFPLAPSHYGFYVLDVSGHGIPAAVKSMQLVQVLSDLSASSVLFNAPLLPGGEPVLARPREVVARLNRLFQQTESDLSYFTMIYGVFNTRSRHVSFCQAGHPSPLVLHPEGGVSVLGAGGYPVGLFNVDEFEDTDIQLGQGDTLMLYSDGVTEVMSPEGEPYGEERLLLFLERVVRQADEPDLTMAIQKEIQAWGGAQLGEKGFEDDISILTLAPGFGQSAGAALPVQQEPVFRFQDTPVALLTPAVSQQGGTTEGGSIVVVDDSRSFLRIVQAMLSNWGHAVFPAYSGDEAVALIEQVQPDFVLTDWDMPGMSGIELCEKVRARKTGSYVYVIMITGYASRDDLLHSLKVGADDFLTKPVNPSELKVRLKTARRMADLHKSLDLKHRELSGLYNALERDMREVSRIQHAFLPENRSTAWPIAIQTLYKPRRFVCGRQIGLLPTRTNELGFFLLSLPGEGTSAALQVMALARWFASPRATQVLFPLEQASHKSRRYLADPRVMQQQLEALAPALGTPSDQVDVLYGLINLDQGTLVVAGVGNWVLVLAEPGSPIRLLQTNPLQPSSDAEKVPSVLCQEVLAPGTRVFALDASTARLLQLDHAEQWQAHVQTTQQQGCLLGQDFSNIAAHCSEFFSNEVLDDLAAIGFQWREHFEVCPLPVTDELLAQCMQEACALASAKPGDPEPAALELGAHLAVSACCAVADTVNIGLLSTRARALIESLGFDENVAYNTDLVLSEALTNIMNHGFAALSPQAVTLIVLVYEQAVVLLLRDQGACIPQAVLEALKPNMSHLDNLALEDLPEGGMGLTFIHMACRRFDYAAAYTVNKPYNQLGLLLTR